MSSHLFAFVIAIDSYKSGNIWNLHSCVDDAHKIRDWLELDLRVPRSHVCLLLDQEATKRSVEDSFVRHLTHNPSIKPGDAILVYFAGHGSSLSAPPGWFQDDLSEQRVNVICPYDHDMKCPGGRIAGISDRSFGAMLMELSASKGDNITVILDCSFTPLSTSQESLRRYTRQTPTFKATPTDLYHGLWPTARPSLPQLSGFFRFQQPSHTLLAACHEDEQALEDKLGGHFTHAFLESVACLELHDISYTRLLEKIAEGMPAVQHPICVGIHKSRVIFNGRAFVQDPRYSRAYPHSHGSTQMLRIDVGEIHGIAVGTMFSLHAHNFKSTYNPSIGRAAASMVTAVSCCATFVPTLSGYNSESRYWAFVVRWREESPLRIHLEATIPSMIRKWKLLRHIPHGTHPGESNFVRVDKARTADLSVYIDKNHLTVEHHAHQLLSNGLFKVASVGRSDYDILADASRFHLQLEHRNLLHPLRSYIDIELHHLEPSAWSRTGWDTRNVEAIGSFVIHNRADIDLWPYLVYMNAQSYTIKLLYQGLDAASLPAHGSLELGPETFSSVRGGAGHFAFLKLYLCSVPTSMTMIEQDPAIRGALLQSEWTRAGAFVAPCPRLERQSIETEKEVVWDTLLVDMHTVN